MSRVEMCIRIGVPFTDGVSLVFIVDVQPVGW